MSGSKGIVVSSEQDKKIPLTESSVSKIEVSSVMSPPFATVKFDRGNLTSNHDTTHNEIITSRYTPFTFFPKCFFEQLIRPANSYFLMICLLQIIKPVSTSEGTPTISVPLTIVLMVAMVKNGYEDWKRHKNDEGENSKQYLTASINSNSDASLVNGDKPARLILKNCRDIKVGDVVVVQDGATFPSDLLIIGVCPKNVGDPPASFCHIETSNIDGETNLKVRYVPEILNCVESPLFDFSGSCLAPDPRRRSSKNVGDIHRLESQCFSTLWTNYSIKLEISGPDGDLDSWKNSQMTIVDNVKDQNKTIQLSLENFLTRGAILQNISHIYGIACYTGRDCKVYKNTPTSGSGKASQFESALGYTVGAMSIIMVSMCIIMSIMTSTWMSANIPGAWYLGTTDSGGVYAFIRFFTWIIIFSQSIPVSLIVSLEMMRFLQAKNMESDPKMKEKFKCGDHTLEKGCNVQDSALNEDLGRVQFVFSDKTGTLTENQLDFRQLLVAGNKIKGGGYTQIAWMNMKRRGFLEKLKRTDNEEVYKMVSSYKVSPAEANEYLQRTGGDFLLAADACQEDKNIEVPHVSFTKSSRNDVRQLIAQSIENKYLDLVLPFDENNKAIRPTDNPDLQNELFFRSLLFNNDIFPVVDIDSYDDVMYNADNPDDVCFGWFCHYIGIRLTPYRKPLKEILIEMPGLDPIQETWKELCICKFSSAKKRMTVVMQRYMVDGSDVKDRRVFVFLKGADSMVKSLACKESLEYYQTNMSDKVDKFCEEGLRTLLIAYACYSESWWEKNWAHRFNQKLDDEHREMLEIEFDQAVKYHICGATAVEDKLQDQVPETIENLLSAGIRTWVLTGDKKETAKNIGCACNLLTPEMEKNGSLHEFEEDTYMEQLKHIDISLSKDTNHGLVITGAAIESIFNQSQDIIDAFVNFSLSCHSVVACRLQPSQKARIVEAIQKATGCVCLAIGDGANDEAMICASNIGVGIAGLEGTAAARASDYAISKFRMLNNLLFFHGRNSYRGTSYMVYYSIYKNVVHIFSFFWFAFYSGFSGNVLYLESVWQMWNACFTALPVFVYVLCDQDISESILLSFPLIYSETNGNSNSVITTQKDKTKSILDRLNSGALYNKYVFGIMLLEAFLQATFAIHILFKVFEDSSSFEMDGKSWGLMEVSVLLMTAFVLFTNLVLCLAFTQYTFYHNFFLFGTIVVYFLYMIFINNNDNSLSYLAGYDYRGIILHLFKKGISWLMIFLVVSVSLLISTFIALIKSLFFSTQLHPYQKYTTKHRPFVSCDVSRFLPWNVSGYLSRGRRQDTAEKN